jgi:aspartate/methionine/tyrosine aminotransferase
MTLPPFLLDEWLDQGHAADPPIEFDLGSSTGPVWTLRELLSLSGHPEGPSEMGAILEAILDTKLLYTPPAGTRELREAIAALEGSDPDCIQVVTGAAEALLLLFFAAAGRDANVILPQPGFPTNDALAASLGIEARHYVLRPENQFRIDLDEIRRLMDRNTRLLLVNSPHNPTGGVLSDAEVESLHDFCAGSGVQFVCDQVYHPIYHGPATRSAARLPQATVLGDFSKALCLSGLRTGWMVEPDPLRRRQYLNARSYFTVSNTVLGERLATLALNRHETIYSRARHIASANLTLLDAFFEAHRDAMRWVRPRGGMTAFPWLTSAADSRPFCRDAMQCGILLAPGDCFGMPAHFRIGFAASGERFAAAIGRLEEFLAAAEKSTACRPSSVSQPA